MKMTERIRRTLTHNGTFTITTVSGRLDENDLARITYNVTILATGQKSTGTLVGVLRADRDGWYIEEYADSGILGQSRSTRVHALRASMESVAFDKAIRTVEGW